jgi:hypothetical protein
MDWRRIIRTDIAASAVVHLTLVALIVLISEVHPFHAPPSDTVAVDIVTPEELKKEEERAPEPVPTPTPTPTPDFRLPEFTVNDKLDETTPPATKAPPEKQAAQQQPAPRPSPQPSPPPRERDANAQPQPTPQPQPPQAQPVPQPQPAPQQAPSYTPPEPDVTVKYGVMLGLPDVSPPLSSDAVKDAPKDNVGGARDTVAAKLSSEVVAELYRHLRSCAKLPAEVSRSDKVHIKLRTFMTTDGRLAAEPALIEASASPSKGLAMMQSAKSALLACQPYTMLPADKYQEWKVLDLTFTPKDFGAS